MALSIQGTPQAVAGTSITIPTHAIGDIIVLFVYRDGNATTPTKPASAGTVPAWVDIDNTSGGNTNSSRTAYFVATANNHTSGTWTNATGMCAIVIRGQSPSPIGGHAESGSTGNGTATAPAITLSHNDGSSIILHFYGHRTVTAWSSAPAGYTRQASVATETAVNTKDTTTSDGSIAQPLTSTNSGYRGASVEIIAPVAYTLTATQQSYTLTFEGGLFQSSPAVALNTPANLGTTPFTTPTFNFTGTDLDGDTIEYQIQVDTVNTFNSLN